MLPKCDIDLEAKHLRHVYNTSSICGEYVWHISFEIAPYPKKLQHG